MRVMMEASMEIFKLILTILQFIGSLFLIAVVLLQSGKSSNLGSIAGVADSFMTKNKASTWDAKLVRLTGFVVAGFIFITLVLSVI